MGADTPFTEEEIRKFLNTPCKNISGHDSNLFLVWDAGIDNLIPWFAEARDYVHVKPMPRDQLIEEITRVHAENNDIKDRIANAFSKDGVGPLPGKEEFRAASTRMYHLFNPDDSTGAFFRDIIKKAFETLNLSPIREAPVRDRGAKQVL